VKVPGSDPPGLLGDVDGEVEGEVEGGVDGGVDGDDDGVVEGDELGGGWDPLHVVPFSAKLAGTGFAPDQDPLNPKFTVPPAGIEPLYEALETVTWPPDCV
jgi:hypothetical protein